MIKRNAFSGLVAVIGVLAFAPVHAQSSGGSGAALTAADRTEIQALVTKYARSLTGCVPADWIDVFDPHTGYFFSTFRGEVKGPDALMAMIKSERYCNPTATPPAGIAPAATANAAPRQGAAPTAPVAVIEPSPEGATGKVDLGGAGAYEDVYVKTPSGWRIKARAVITPKEAAAKLTSQDFIEIRKLAGNDLGQFEDVYTDTPQGRRFRSSGVVLGLLADGVRGTAYLRNDGGHYDDVYVKTTNGWRFQSRTYVPAAEK